MDIRTLQRRRANSLAVREILSSMRALSAVQLRRGQAALRTVAAYETSVARGLAVAGFAPIRQPRPTHAMLVVIGSDQGMCGSLTRHLVARAGERLGRLRAEVVRVVAVGRRTRGLLEELGYGVDFVHDSPTSIHGVDALVGALAEHLVRELPGGECCRVEVVYNRHGAAQDDERASALRVYPPQPTPQDDARPLASPHSYEPLPAVVDRLLLEWSYAAIYRCALEALTAEHDARLRTTDAAVHAVDDKLEALGVELNRLRQEQITNELLELAAAASLAGGGARGPSARAEDV